MDLISLLVTLAVVCLVFYVVIWGINQVGLPNPWDVILKVGVVIVALIVLLRFLNVGTGPILI